MFRKIPQAITKNHRPAALSESKHIAPKVAASMNNVKATHTLHFAELPDLFFSHEVDHAESKKASEEEHHPTNFSW